MFSGAPVFNVEPLTFPTMPTKINLHEKLNEIGGFWEPAIVGALNGQQVKLARFKGEFMAHRHEQEDEMFLVLKGAFTMELNEQTIELKQGEMIIIPRGVLHRPVAKEEAHVLLFEPSTTLQKGNASRNEQHGPGEKDSSD